jgi:hypothetical protein
MAAAGQQAAPADHAAIEWDMPAHHDVGEEPGTPVIDSPSIAGDWPANGDGSPSIAHDDIDEIKAAKPRRQSGFRTLLGRSDAPGKSFVSLPMACAAMGALVLALVIWRSDVVRLLPQAAAFYKMVGLEVNVRGLMFKDVKVTSETVDGKPVLVIEGMIVGETRKPVELPRLRFSVRDAQGAEIYAWNAMLEQAVLKPGERAWFKSRLASPPPEGRNIDVRFFNKRDLASGTI